MDIIETAVVQPMRNSTTVVAINLIFLANTEHFFLFVTNAQDENLGGCGSKNDIFHINDMKIFFMTSASGIKEAVKTLLAMNQRAKKHHL